MSGVNDWLILLAAAIAYLPYHALWLRWYGRVFSASHSAPDARDTYRPSTDGAAVVATSFHWRPIDASTPRGCKLQLINRDAGVACYGRLGSKEDHWTHWAPLPTFQESV